MQQGSERLRQDFLFTTLSPSSIPGGRAAGRCQHVSRSVRTSLEKIRCTPEVGGPVDQQTDRPTYRPEVVRITLQFLPQTVLHGAGIS